MKSLFVVLFMVSLGGKIYAATENEPAILNHRIVIGLHKMLNERHGNACPALTPSNINWMCIGAMPKEKPSLLASGCGFAVRSICDGEVLTIRGSITSYSLYSSQPLPQDFQNLFTPTQISLSEFSFAPVAN